MWHKTARIVFVFVVIVAAIWVYLKMVAEPLVLDINHSKREAKELRHQVAKLEQSRVDVAEMKRSEYGRLEFSRQMLRKRLVSSDSVSLHAERVLAALRRRARSMGLGMHALEDVPVNKVQHFRMDLPVTGTRMRRISARIRGPKREWGHFLEAASRLPAYLTLRSVQVNVEDKAEMRVEWILHQISANDPLPQVRPELLNTTSSLLDHPIPALDSRRAVKRGEH